MHLFGIRIDLIFQRYNLRQSFYFPKVKSWNMELKPTAFIFHCIIEQFIILQFQWILRSLNKIFKCFVLSLYGLLVNWIAHKHTRRQSNIKTHKRTWTLVVSRSIQFAGIQNKISLFYTKSGWVNEYVIYLKSNAATYWLNSKTQTPYHQSEQGVMSENYVIGSIRCVVFRLYNALVMLLNSASNTIISKILKIRTVLVNMIMASSPGCTILLATILMQ